MGRALALLTLLLLAGCDRAWRPTPEQRYATWESSNAAAVAGYRTFLARHGVADALPMPELLRTARRWRRCGAAEFEVPAQSRWPRMVPTLHVVARMRSDGLLVGSRAASVYRNETLNRCEGGAARSQHRLNSAIDFDLAAAPGNVERPCRFWRERGPALQLGLGFYAPTRIHLDTAGFRTWGRDFRRGTSLCVASSQARQS